jgi:four helix bundle protein
MVTDKKFLKLNDIESYRISFQLSNYVWILVIDWSYLAQDTVGKQFIRAIDSVSANIAEGFGRYSKKDKIKFYYYARASVKEALDWNEKAFIRKLITKEQYKYIFSVLEILPRSVNQLIKFTNFKLQQ